MRYFIPIFCSIFMLVGLVLAAYGMRDLIKAGRSGSWPTVEGTIIRSQINTKSDSDGSTYAPEIEFRYAVGDQVYTSTCIRAGMRMSASHRFAAAFTSRFRVGATAQIGYDPLDPASAILEPGIHKQAFLGTAGGLGFAFLGAWFLLMAWLTSV
jgi:hypothetical protein